MNSGHADIPLWIKWRNDAQLIQVILDGSGELFSLVFN